MEAKSVGLRALEIRRQPHRRQNIIAIRPLSLSLSIVVELGLLRRLVRETEDLIAKALSRR